MSATDATPVTDIEGKSEVKEKEYEEGTLESPASVKITAKHQPRFYIRAARNFLEGTKDKPAVECIKISALGNAIASAITVAAKLTELKTGIILNVKTDYKNLHGPNPLRFAPQLEITIQRHVKTPEELEEEKKAAKKEREKAAENVVDEAD